MKKTIIPSNIILYLGLVSLAFGVTAITVPEFTISTIIIVIGVVIALGGITTMILRLKDKSDSKFLQILFLIGSSLNIAFGAVLIILPDVFLEVFILIFGISIIIGGIVQLVISLSFTPLSTTAKVFIGLSLIMIIAGTVFIINPFNAAEAITVFFGIVVTIFGLTCTIMSFWVKSELLRLKHHPKKVIEVEEVTEVN